MSGEGRNSILRRGRALFGASLLRITKNSGQLSVVRKSQKTAQAALERGTRRRRSAGE